MVTGPGNVYVTAAKRLLRGRGRHRRRGRPDRDRGARRRHRRPGARRRRPDQPGRARPARPPRCWSPTPARRWPTRSTPSWRARSAPTKHGERVRAALTGPQSGTVLVADLDAGLAVVDAYAAEHLEIQTARRARGGRAGCATPARLRRAVVAGLARRLLRRVQPRAAHRRLRPALRRAVGADVPARRAPRRVRRGRAGARWPTTWSRSRTPRTCRRTAQRDHARGRLDRREPAALVRSTTCRCATDLRGRSPVRRAAARRRRSGSTPTRTPTRCRPAVLDDIGRPRGPRPRGLQPLPRPGRGRAARGPRGVPRPRRWRPPPASGRRTAPTRSSSSCCRPSAARAAPRSASSRRTRCTRSSRPAPAPAGCAGTRDADFALDAAAARPRRSREHRPDVVFLTCPNNPTGTALPLATVEAVLARRARAWSSSTRRTRSSPGPACRAR